jgi:hypothetical protein
MPALFNVVFNSSDKAHNCLAWIRLLASLTRSASSVSARSLRAASTFLMRYWSLRTSKRAPKKSAPPMPWVRLDVSAILPLPLYPSPHFGMRWSASYSLDEAEHVLDLTARMRDNAVMISSTMPSWQNTPALARHSCYRTAERRSKACRGEVETDDEKEQGGGPC